MAEVNLTGVTDTLLKQIELVVMDVDGVLTNGAISYTEGGKEIKSFSVKDGHAMSVWSYFGKPLAIITARTSTIVQIRAEELGVKYLYQGVKNKQKALIELCQTLELPVSSVCYMGDDWPDLSVLRMVGLATCPADAAEEVKAVCHWVSSKKGGKGAVRELLDMLIKSQGLPVAGLFG